VRKNSQASPISIDLRKIILFTFQFSAFLHRLGHLRQFGDVGGMSAYPPIATKMLRRDERRIGPIGDVCSPAQTLSTCRKSGVKGRSIAVQSRRVTARSSIRRGGLPPWDTVVKWVCHIAFSSAMHIEA
jgi:hypothetical protein